ncbi:MAG: biotin--[acetyl-CoA-carboxylase] ligase [Pseudomonadota bacterium]
MSVKSETNEQQASFKLNPDPIIEVVEETGSTNADLLARLSAGEAIPDNYWLRAERQTSGRGRLGRRWESPTGNLFCSTFVAINDDDPPPHTLCFVVGLAVSDMLRRSLIADSQIILKWPNDALVNGCKIAGILLERNGAGVVAGIGVNVCYAPDVPGRKTTSTAQENGKHGGSPEQILSILAEEFGCRLSRWRAEPLSKTLDEWMKVAHPIGSPLTVGSGQDAVSGAFAGLDEEGALLLRLANEAIRTIHAGDVSMISQGTQ